MAHLGGRDQGQHAIHHAKARPQDGNDGKLPSGDHFGLAAADGGLHCDFLEGKIPGGLVAHQGGYLAGQLPEVLAAGLLFAHQGDFVLDEGMIEDLGFKGLRHVFSSCDSIGNGCVVTE